MLFIIINIIIFSMNYKIVSLMNCLQDDIKFEKIFGMRFLTMNNANVLYKSNGKYPMNIECVSQCMKNPECYSFTVHYNICYWWTRNDTPSDIVPDDKVDLFFKICINNVKDCKKLWVFERISGATLIGNDTRIIGDTTRSQCQQFCIDEKKFTCRSIKFKIKSLTYDDTTGDCILSNTDRHISPYTFRVSNYNDEYIENQCAELLENNNNCYDEYTNTSLLSRTELFYETRNMEECENFCNENNLFNCRSFTLISLPSKTYSCLLHSGDTRVYSALLEQNNNSTYFEKTLCLKITASCSETYLQLNFIPDLFFEGVMYMEGYYDSYDCFTLGRGYNMLMLKIPLMGKKCGLIIESDPDEILISGTMILQYNRFIQTQNDRIIRVGCILKNTSQLVLGTGLEIENIPSNKGGFISNISTNFPNLNINMRIVDSKTQKDIFDTYIGQELQLIIELKNISEHLDISPGNLLAMTENMNDSIVLLDERGCSMNNRIFPAFYKVITNDSIRLIANFQAFKFASSPVVRFSAVVKFCNNMCPEIKCNSENLVMNRRAINALSYEDAKPRNQKLLEKIVAVRDQYLLKKPFLLEDNIYSSAYGSGENKNEMELLLFIKIISLVLILQIYHL